MGHVTSRSRVGDNVPVVRGPAPSVRLRPVGCRYGRGVSRTCVGTDRRSSCAGANLCPGTGRSYRVVGSPGVAALMLVATSATAIKILPFFMQAPP